MIKFESRVSRSSGGVVGTSAACSVYSSVFLCVSMSFQRRKPHFECRINENWYFWVDFSRSLSRGMTSPFKVRPRPPAHKLSGPIWDRNITIVSSNVTLSLRYKYTNDCWFIFESKIVFRASIPSRSDLDPIKRRSKGIILPMLAISNKMGTKNRPKIIKITKIMMKNRFFKFSLETFLGHLEGVGWLYRDDFDSFWCDI